MEDIKNGCDYNKEGICSNKENLNYNKSCSYKNQDKCPSSDFIKDTIGKVHETENYLRKRQFDPSECDKDTFRTFEIGKGKKAVGCKVNGKFKVQSILEPKGKEDFAFNFNPAELRMILQALDTFISNGNIENDPYFRDTILNIVNQIDQKGTGKFNEVMDEAIAIRMLLEETYKAPNTARKGQGWWGESERHSKAKKEGKADLREDFIEMDKQLDITDQFPDLKGDFTVLYGPIMRDGPFDYVDKKSGKTFTVYKGWNNLKEVSKGKTYIPARATEEDGAHQAPILGFSYGFEPREESHQIYAKTVLLNDYADLPSEGSQVSIGFPDEIQGNKQIVKDLDHIAISLRNKEQGRCKRKGYGDCYQKVIPHDQNLIEKEVV